MLENNKLISVVIPVKNGKETIAQCLNAIVNQSNFQKCEIIIIDSGSTDGTLDLLESFPVNIVQIEPEAFNHGRTRNLGVSHASGEFVVMTVQDAVATDNNWLEQMIQHFSDPEVAAVCGQQIVPKDYSKNPHEWFQPFSDPEINKVQFKSKKQFEALTDKQKKKFSSIDNVTTVYRKSVLQSLPFEAIAYGEDMLWGKMALLNGHALVYDHYARVAHYHFHFPEYTFKRTLISRVFTYACFGYVRPQGYHLKDYILVVYRNLKRGLDLKWIPHNWRIIYYNRKATKLFLKKVKMNEVEDLIKELSLNVPMGKQKSNLHV